MRAAFFSFVFIALFPVYSFATDYSSDFPRIDGPLTYEQTLKALNDSELRYESFKKEIEVTCELNIAKLEQKIDVWVQELKQCTEDSCRKDKMWRIEDAKKSIADVQQSKAENLYRLSLALNAHSSDFITSLFQNYVVKAIPVLIVNEPKLVSGYIEYITRNGLGATEWYVKSKVLDTQYNSWEWMIFWSTSLKTFSEVKSFLVENPESETEILGFKKHEINKTMINGGELGCTHMNSEPYLVYEPFGFSSRAGF